MRKSNGTRPVNKTDGPKGRGKKQMSKSRREDGKKLIRDTDFEKVRTFLEEAQLPYEAGVNHSNIPYLFVNFDDKGKAVEPQD